MLRIRRVGWQHTHVREMPKNLWQICGKIGGKTIILNHQSSKPAG